MAPPSRSGSGNAADDDRYYRHGRGKRASKRSTCRPGRNIHFVGFEQAEMVIVDCYLPPAGSGDPQSCATAPTRISSNSGTRFRRTPPRSQFAEPENRAALVGLCRSAPSNARARGRPGRPVAWTGLGTLPDAPYGRQRVARARGCPDPVRAWTLRKCQTLALSSNRHRIRLDIRANLGSNRCTNAGRSR
jgi:hypothetical protein